MSRLHFFCIIIYYAEPNETRCIVTAHRISIGISMGKTVFISEKPSVAQQFADALGLSFAKRDGYMESQNTIITWCVGHLVSMSYPEVYDEKYKRWSLQTIPFIPDQFKYQVIGDVKKQFNIVKRILTSDEVDTIYICTDSGREGEYIYRLVAQEAGVKGKKQLRVWIDSQTKDEIIRGIKQAKDDSEYDNLGAAAYLRAKEDYLMGINFSRALSLRYGRSIRDYLGMDHCVIAVGRVMTCVLGIVVDREREIRAFVKTPFFRISGTFAGADAQGEGDATANSFTADWFAADSSHYFQSPKLYKDNGFLKKEDAEALINELRSGPDDAGVTPVRATVQALGHKKETKNPPLLYNLAELQNDCSRYFKISPDQTLVIAQELYEKKLTTYPRTDARVLSSAVAKEIDKNLRGVGTLPMYQELVNGIFASESYKKIGKSKYTNDKAITDHYAIIPTGQGFQNLAKSSDTTQKVYELIVRRFLSIFYPAAIYDKMSLTVSMKTPFGTELFSTSQKVCKDRGYLDVCTYSFFKGRGKAKSQAEPEEDKEDGNDASTKADPAALERFLKTLKKGDALICSDLSMKEGETSPPKRYNSGSMILTMENAGQFIEDEELREQIKGSGIGTSATRADILKKLVTNRYLDLNKKTQIYTPTQLGEMIYDTVRCSVASLLNPKLTASWELGLTRVAEGSVTEEEYMQKLSSFVSTKTTAIKDTDFTAALQQQFRREQPFYPKKMTFTSHYKPKTTRTKTKTRAKED